MKTPWHTAWQGSDVVVFRDDAEVDRFTADRVERVIFVHRGTGETPGDMSFAVVELPDECIIFPAETGFEAACISSARRSGKTSSACTGWPNRRHPCRHGCAAACGCCGPARRHTADCLARNSSVLERWPVSGPQTWEQRKWLRIERSRPFGTVTQPGALDAVQRKRA